MSRIGKAPITIPSGVEVTFVDSVMTVKGKKGELAQHIDASVNVSMAKRRNPTTKTIGKNAIIGGKEDEKIFRMGKRIFV